MTQPITTAVDNRIHHNQLAYEGRASADIKDVANDFAGFSNRSITAVPGPHYEPAGSQFTMKFPNGYVLNLYTPLQDEVDGSSDDMNPLGLPQSLLNIRFEFIPDVVRAEVSILDPQKNWVAFGDGLFCKMVDVSALIQIINWVNSLASPTEEVKKIGRIGL